MDKLIDKDLNSILLDASKLWQQVKNKKIFLSGGTGFFGTWILKSFLLANKELALNSEIKVLTRNIYNHKNKHPELHEDNSISYLEGDIRNFSFPLDNFSYIIHAATTNAEETFNHQDPITKYDTIVQGTKRILDFAVKCKCKKFLLTSTGSCYGKQPSEIMNIPESYVGAPMTNDQNFNFSILGEAKRTSEILTSVYSQKFNIETKIARCFSFVGPYMPLNIHYAIGNFIADIIKGETINIKSDGKPFRSYMYASDLVVWLLTILLNGKDNEIYNVGSEESISIYELAKKISKLSSKKIKINLQNKNQNEHINRYIPSIKKAKEELNLSPKINLEEAIIKSLTHAKSNKKYYNII